MILKNLKSNPLKLNSLMLVPKNMIGDQIKPNIIGLNLEILF